MDDDMKHMDLDLGLNLQGYVKIGLKEVANSPCLLCGHQPPNTGGMLFATDRKGQEMIGAPQQTDKQRIIFYALCNNCAKDPQYKNKVAQSILNRIQKKPLAKPKPVAPKAKGNVIGYVIQAENGKLYFQMNPQLAAAHQTSAMPIPLQLPGGPIRMPVPSVINKPKVIQNDDDQCTLQF